MGTRKLVLKQTEPAIPVEVIATAVKEISEGIKRLRDGPLNEKALVLLIQNAIVTRSSEKEISQRDVRRVLGGIGDLEATYLKRR